MAIDRRDVLLSIAAGLAAAPFAARAASMPAAAVTTARRSDGSFALIGLNAAGGITCEAALPGRGHGLAVHPARPLVAAFGRRPGRWTALFETGGGHHVATIVPPTDHFFSGHGFFLPDGMTLAIVEIVLPRGEGRIGLYDARERFRRIGDFSTHGVGAHEAILLGDGATIAVANGGLLPDPDTGGDLKPLRMASGGSSVVLIDAHRGTRLASVRAPETQTDFGYRHLAGVDDQSLAVGLQALDPDRAPEIPSLARLITQQGRQRWLAPGNPLWGTLSNYVGSVVSRDGRIAFTSPRGGRAVILDPAHDAILVSQAEADVCGVAGLAPGAFLLTTGFGAVVSVEIGGTVRPLAALTGYQFDNHAVALSS